MNEEFSEATRPRANLISASLGHVLELQRREAQRKLNLQRVNTGRAWRRRFWRTFLAIRAYLEELPSAKRNLAIVQHHIDLERIQRNRALSLPEGEECQEWLRGADEHLRWIKDFDNERRARRGLPARDWGRRTA